MIACLDREMTPASLETTKYGEQGVRIARACTAPMGVAKWGAAPHGRTRGK